MTEGGIGGVQLARTSRAWWLSLGLAAERGQGFASLALSQRLPINSRASAARSGNLNPLRCRPNSS